MKHLETLLNSHELKLHCFKFSRHSVLADIRFFNDLSSQFLILSSFNFTKKFNNIVSSPFYCKTASPAVYSKMLTAPVLMLDNKKHGCVISDPMHVRSFINKSSFDKNLISVHLAIENLICGEAGSNTELQTIINTSSSVSIKMRFGRFRGNISYFYRLVRKGMRREQKRWHVNGFKIFKRRHRGNRFNFKRALRKAQRYFLRRGYTKKNFQQSIVKKHTAKYQHVSYNFFYSNGSSFFNEDRVKLNRYLRCPDSVIWHRVSVLFKLADLSYYHAPLLLQYYSHTVIRGFYDSTLYFKFKLSNVLADNNIGVTEYMLLCGFRGRFYAKSFGSPAVI